MIVEAQCQAHKPNSFLAFELWVDRIAPKHVFHMTVTCQSCRSSKPRVKLQGALDQSECLGQPFAGRKDRLLYSPEIKIIRGEVFRSPPPRHCNFCLKQLWLNSGDNGERDFVLQRENVSHVTLEPVRPNVCARSRLNQLARDANFPRRLALRPLKDIAHAKPAPDFLDVDRFALEGETRISSDHEQPFEPRKRGSDLLNHPVREVLLLGIARHVRERQHGDGGLVGNCRSALGRIARIWARNFSRLPHLSDETESLTR